MEGSDALGMQITAGLDAQPMEAGTKQATANLLSISSAAKTAGAGLGITAGALAVVTMEALKLQEQAAELRKLLGDDMAATMTESIVELSGQLPATRKELFAITEQAARLGIRGEENLTRFTKTVAAMSSATDLSAANAANSMAKIARVTGTPISQIRNLSAAVNHLANNYGTSASEIIKATGKLAPTLSQLGIAAPRIMGIATAMNEVNVSVRRGATRLRRVFQQTMNPKKFETIAEAINLTESEFRQLMASGEGAEEIFSRMIGVFATGGKAAEMLRVELSSASRQGLGAISRQGSRVEEAMDDASDAFRLGTSTIIEDMKKSETAGTQLGVAWASIKGDAAELGESTADLTNKYIQQWNWSNRVTDMMEKYDANVITAASTVRQLNERLSQGSGDLKDYREKAGGVTNAIGRMNARVAEGDQFLSQAEAIESATAALDKQVSIDALSGEEASTALAEIQRHLQLLGPQARTTFIRRILPAINNTEVGARRLINAMAIISQRLQLLNQTQPDFVTSAIFPADVENMFQGYPDGLDDSMDATDKLIQKLKEQRAEMNKGHLARIRLTEAWKTASDEERRTIEEIVNQLQFGQIRNELRSTTEQLAAGQDDLLRYRDGWDELTDSQQKALKQMRRVNDGLRRVRDIMEEHEGLDFGQAFLVDVMNRQEELEGQMALTKIPEWATESAQAMEDFESRIRRVSPPMSDEEWQAWVREFKDDTDEAEADWKDFQDEIDALSLATVQSQLRFVEDVIKDVSNAFAESFEAMVDDSKDLEDALSDLLEKLGGSLLQRGIQLGLMKLLTDPVKNAQGETTGMNFLWGLMNFGNVNPGGTRAHGGPVSPNTAYTVGEQGTELFVPDVSGTIIPHKALNAVGGGGGANVQVVQEFNMSAVDERGISRLIEQNRGRIAQETVRAIERSEIATRKVNAGRRGRRR